MLTASPRNPDRGIDSSSQCHGHLAHESHGRPARGRGCFASFPFNFLPFTFYFLPSPRRPRRQGFALLLVLLLVAIIFIVGLAAITAATSSSLSGSNFVDYATALQGAQSGIEVARRYLDHPWEAGLSWGQTWPGTGSYCLMPAPSDTDAALHDVYYSVTVTASANSSGTPVYLVASTGRALAPGGDPAGDSGATRTVTAIFQQPAITLPNLVTSAGALYLPANSHVNGSVFCDQNAIVAAGATVQNNLAAVGTITAFGTVSGLSTPSCSALFIPPVIFNQYAPTYSFGGSTNTAVLLAGSLLTGVPPLSMPGNPDNIFYSTADFTISNATVAGGGFVTSGNLTLSGTVSIAAPLGFPALVVGGDLLINRNASIATAGTIAVAGTIRMVNDDGSEVTDASLPQAVWFQTGPLLFTGPNSFSTYSTTNFTANFDATRATLQPVSHMPLPLPIISYAEN